MKSELKIYVASLTRHAPRWLALRQMGLPIISTWIDEAEEGATSDWADLWDRNIREAGSADVCLLYREPGEMLKGALAEFGATLFGGGLVLWVGSTMFGEPPKEFSGVRHGRVIVLSDLGAAIGKLQRLAIGLDELPRGSSA